jgi:pyruvate dehydrogenase E2 component (dihydrolipoamide acetyltransferase)
MVVAWHAAEGAEVAAGDDLLEIETTKITNVFEAPAAGTLRRVVAAEGETVLVGALLAVIAPAEAAEPDIDAFVAEYQDKFAVLAAEAAAAAPEPEYIEAGGRRLRFLRLGADGGESTPVLLVHGFSGDLNSWALTQPVLAEAREAIALDLPGHGSSTKEVGAGDVGALAAAALDFMDALGLERAHLVGHSLGGAIALQLALDHPERAASLTLIASVALGPEISMDFIDGLIAAKRNKHMRAVLEMLVHDPATIGRELVEEKIRFKRIDGVDAALRGIAEAAFGGGEQSLALAGRLGDLAVPAQVIWGAGDRIVPASHAEGLPETIAVHILPEAGHMVHMEKAAEVTALITDIMARGKQA